MDIKKISLIIVGVLWLLVGVGLSAIGTVWILKLSFWPKVILFLIIALTAGLLKGKFVLEKVASKYYKRAEAIKFSRIDIFTGSIKILGLKGIILIGLMIGISSFLRHSNFDRPILGTIYLAVGIALVYASKIFLTTTKQI